jgi:hypothetical protein
VTVAARRFGCALATVAACGAAALGPAHARAAGAFAPPDSVETRRGAAVAERFELARRFELTLGISNAFTEQNRAAMARVESRVAAVPGVRQVIGPARLQAITVDGAGRVTMSPLTSRALGGGPAAFEGQLLLRADAAGWFISPDGSQLRLLVDTADLPKVRWPIEAAVASSGLVLLEGTIPAAPLWPDPERDSTGWSPITPLELALLMLLLPFVALAVSARPAARRAWLCVMAAALATALPGVVAPVAGIRRYALLMGLAAALALLAVLLVTAGVRLLRGRSRASVPGKRAPGPLVIVSVALLASAVWQARRLRMETGLWSEAPLFFVDVRADLAEPVVLRELRRMTELLRVEPGVDQVWSVADLFGAIPRPELGPAGIPSDKELTRTILKRARADAAVQLELAPDLQEALMVVRIDDDSGMSHARVRRRVAEVLKRRFRPTLLRIDVTDPAVPLATRALGRGFLAEDARERVLSLCEQAGRNLEPEQAVAIEEELRRVALAPRLDVGAFRKDAARVIEAFVEETALAGKHVSLPHPAERQRLIEGLLASAGEPSAQEVTRRLAELWGTRFPPRALQAHAVELGRRLGALRRRAMVALHAKAILAAADLPSEGGLSDEVRDATLEAMGPIVGVPAALGTADAFAAANTFAIDVALVGGVVSDQTLSALWPPRLRLGLVVAVLVSALLLLAIGGREALGWLPVGLSPAAVVLIIPTVLGVSTGALFVAVLSGALGGGTAFALAFAPARGEA